MIQGVFKKGLTVVSKETALEFYKGVKSVILIPFSEAAYIRIEPHQLFSILPAYCVRRGLAPFEPSIFDEDGSLAYKYRRSINQYLKGM